MKCHDFSHVVVTVSSQEIRQCITDPLLPVPGQAFQHFPDWMESIFIGNDIDSRTDFLFACQCIFFFQIELQVILVDIRVVFPFSVPGHFFRDDSSPCHEIFPEGTSKYRVMPQYIEAVINRLTRCSVLGLFQV